MWGYYSACAKPIAQKPCYIVTGSSDQPRYFFISPSIFFYLIQVLDAVTELLEVKRQICYILLTTVVLGTTSVIK